MTNCIVLLLAFSLSFLSYNTLTAKSDRVQDDDYVYYEDKGDDNYKFKYIQDFGVAQIAVEEIMEPYQDKSMKLFKLKMTREIITPLGSVKVDSNYIEQLLPCNKSVRKLAGYSDQQISQQFNCLPLIRFESNKVKISKNLKELHMRVGYAEMNMKDFKIQIMLIPLKRELTLKHISNTIKKTNGIDRLDFVPDFRAVGYEIKFFLLRRENDKQSFKLSDTIFDVSGKLYIAQNITVDESQDEDSKLFFIDMLTKNSHNTQAFVHLSDLEITKQGYPITTNIDFLSLVRDRFPYLLVNHNISISPMLSILEYTGTVRQVRSSKFPSDVRDLFPSNYDTLVNIESKSGMLDFLNFRLEQEFFSKDNTIHNETMILGTKLFTATVGAKTITTKRKSEFNFTKQFHIVPPSNLDILFDPLSQVGELVKVFDKQWINFEYSNQTDSNRVSFTVEVDKKVLNDFVTFALSMYNSFK